MNCQQLKIHSATGSVLVRRMAGADPSPIVQESPFPCPCTYRIEVPKSPPPEDGLTSEYDMVILDLIVSTVLFHCHD